jgi:hypothetical protein
MANIGELSDEALAKKINSAKIAVERNVGLIKEASEKKLKKLIAEQEKRAGFVEKEIEKEAKKVEKKVEKVVEPKKEAKKEATKKPAPKKKKPRVYPSPASNFELVIDGKTYKFDNLKSKEECEKAIKAVKARRAEQIKNQKAREEGAEKARTIPVTRKISDGFVSIAKKAVAEVPKTKVEKKPEEIKKELDAVEKAFNSLFDKLESLMDRKISANDRKAVMSILTKFEEKVDKGSDKKSKATAKKKEDGGIIDDSNTWDNDWSYASLMES